MQPDRPDETPRSVLDDLDRDGQGSDAAAGEETFQLAVFWLAGERYGLRAATVETVVPMAKVAWVPGAPHFLRGVINHRAEVVPVIDLRRLLALPEGEQGGDPRIVIARVPGIPSPVGCLVDELDDVRDVPVSGVKPPLPTLAEHVVRFVEGQIHTEDGVVVALRLEPLAQVEG